VIDFDEFLSISPENYLQGRSVLEILEQDFDDEAPNLCLPAAPWVGQSLSNLVNGTNLIAFLAGAKLCPVVNAYNGFGSNNRSNVRTGDTLTNTAYVAVHQGNCFKSIYRTAAQKALTGSMNMHIAIDPEQGYLHEHVLTSSFTLNHVKGSVPMCQTQPSNILALQLTSALAKGQADPAVIRAAREEFIY
jgi:hypothetical protein